MPDRTSKLPTSHIERAMVAASTLKQLSEVSRLPYVKVVAGVSLLIMETVRNVKSNKDQCLAMIDQIDELLCVIIELCMDSPAAIPPASLQSIAKFSETLQKIESFMRAQQDRGRIRRFFRQQENTVGLEDCKMGLRQALDVLSVRSRTSVLANLEEFRIIEERRHHQLLALLALEDHSDQASSILSEESTAFSQLGSLRDSFSSLSLLLPSVPQIFHGRDSELDDVVTSLLKAEARVAILGPGGIGKTCLARTAMHHPDVLSKYPERYFVSCESSQTVGDLIAAVASALGLDLSGKLSQKIVKSLSTKDSCLLVLDNFETPWEPTETRGKVEEFLSLLTTPSKVALLVTMRGQERPLGTRWTRPFIQPLKPLTAVAAREIFMNITDAEGHDDEIRISELLALTGNLPLTVTLMAHVVAFEGCESVLSRWKRENVSVLSEGSDKETNLETSLRLSLSSPRMASSPGALQLLGLLSLLPDGILDSDLTHSACPIPDIPRCKSTLLRTSLAYLDADRLKVLVPVREFIKKTYPPFPEIVRSLRLYWDGFFTLWRSYTMPSGDLINRLAANVGNISSLLRYGLQNTDSSPDLKDIVYGIFYLNSFLCDISHSITPLMADIAQLVNRVDDDKLCGYYIWSRFNQDAINIPKADVPHLIEEGRRYFRLAGDVSGEARFNETVGVYYFRSGDSTKAFQFCEAALELANKADDNGRRHYSTCFMAAIKNVKGEFREALVLARSAQKFAAMLGMFYRETKGIQEEARAWIGLGNFVYGVELCGRARELLIAAGLQGSAYELTLLDFEADIRLKKTEYPESRAINEIIVRSTSVDSSPLFHANSLANIISIDIALGLMTSEDVVMAGLDKTRRLFTADGYARGFPMCDRIFADYLASSGQKPLARDIYQRCVREARGASAAVMAASLRKLGDITLELCDMHTTFRWATTYLAFAKTTRSVLFVAWAFRLLGDICRIQGDDDTASTLLHVALDEFTRMDIHQGRGECFLGLSDIAKRRGDNAVGMAYFEHARRMFEDSGLAMNLEAS